MSKVDLQENVFWRRRLLDVPAALACLTWEMGLLLPVHVQKEELLDSWLSWGY